MPEPARKRMECLVYCEAAVMPGAQSSPHTHAGYRWRFLTIADSALPSSWPQSVAKLSQWDPMEQVVRSSIGTGAMLPHATAPHRIGMER